MSPSRAIFHVDLDAFFASVEQLDHPELRGLPVIVGAAPGRRGVVCACSYEARAFGLHSAMPISEAYRLCPGGRYLPVRMERYAEMSERVMAIFAETAPDLRRVSIDEAFLDLTGTERLYGPAEAAARALKARVKAETGLTISIGLAANHYVAKIASGLGKPDGLVAVPPGGEAEFMLRLPLSRLWGAGEKTQERFAELGIGSVAELASLDDAALEARFGKAGGRFLRDAARGVDPGIYAERSESRSMSGETTFERDVRDRDAVEQTVMELCDGLAYRLWSEGLESRTVVLKLRFGDFTTISRRSSRAEPYRAAAEARRDLMGLFDAAWDGRRPIRLVGAGFAELREPGYASQGELFARAGEREARAETAVFELERRGLGNLTRARLLGQASRRGRRGPFSPGAGDGSRPSP